MKEERKLEYPGTSFTKCHILQYEDLSPKRDSNLHNSIDGVFSLTIWVLVSVIAVFWATIPNPTRPRVADSGTPYRYIG